VILVTGGQLLEREDKRRNSNGVDVDQKFGTIVLIVVGGFLFGTKTRRGCGDCRSDGTFVTRWDDFLRFLRRWFRRCGRTTGFNDLGASRLKK